MKRVWPSPGQGFVNEAADPGGARAQGGNGGTTLRRGSISGRRGSVSGRRGSVGDSSSRRGSITADRLGTVDMTFSASHHAAIKEGKRHKIQNLISTALDVAVARAFGLTRFESHSEEFTYLAEKFDPHPAFLIWLQLCAAGVSALVWLETLDQAGAVLGIALALDLALIGRVALSASRQKPNYLNSRTTIEVEIQTVNYMVPAMYAFVAMWLGSRPINAGIGFCAQIMARLIIASLSATTGMITVAKFTLISGLFDLLVLAPMALARAAAGRFGWDTPALMMVSLTLVYVARFFMVQKDLASRSKWEPPELAFALEEHGMDVAQIAENNQGSRKSRHRKRSSINIMMDETGSVESMGEQFFKALDSDEGTARIKIDPHDVEILDYVGRGAIGEVFEARYMDAPVVLKRLPPTLLNKEICDQFIAEIKLLKGLRHPNVVQMMGVTWDEKTELIGMVLELMTQGSLRSVLCDRSLILSWEDPLCKLALDISKGMSFLHGLDIIHRDLKTDNILVNATFTGKVSDFGTSRVIDREASTQVGTPFWRAPEMIRAEKYNLKADVYSFALVLYEIAIQKNPFDEMSQMDALEFPYKVAHEEYRLAIPDDVPVEIRSIIEQCWHTDPSKRPSFMLISRMLKKYQAQLAGGMDLDAEAGLARVMMDQIIMSGESTTVRYEAGDIIAHHGDTDEFCYIVTKGAVEIFVPLQEMPEFNPLNPDFQKKWANEELICAGQFFGEMAMFTSTEQWATCRAKEDVTCLKFDQDAFAKVDDDVRDMVIAKIFRRMNAMEKKKETFTESRKKLMSTILTRTNTIKKGGSFFEKGSSFAYSRSSSSASPAMSGISLQKGSTPAITAPKLESESGSIGDFASLGLWNAKAEDDEFGVSSKKATVRPAQEVEFQPLSKPLSELAGKEEKSSLINTEPPVIFSKELSRDQLFGLDRIVSQEVSVHGLHLPNTIEGNQCVFMEEEDESMKEEEEEDQN